MKTFLSSPDPAEGVEGISAKKRERGKGKGAGEGGTRTFRSGTPSLKMKHRRLSGGSGVKQRNEVGVTTSFVP